MSIISIFLTFQKDLLSKADAERVKELNFAMDNFLTFADSSEVDVIIDLQNFAHRVLKAPSNRPYHCPADPKHFLQHLFSSEQEFYQGEAAVFYEALGKGFEVAMTHAKQKFKGKAGELKVLILTPEGANISTLIQNFSTGISITPKISNNLVFYRRNTPKNLLF